MNNDAPTFEIGTYAWDTTRDDWVFIVDVVNGLVYEWFVCRTSEYFYCLVPEEDLEHREIKRA